MSKYYIPVEIEGKWWVVENAPDRPIKSAFSSSYSYENALTTYCQLLMISNKYPTLESDSAYWASKEGVKMGEWEFIIRDVGSDSFPFDPLYLAIPIQSPTTKELIEQEAENKYLYRYSGDLEDLEFNKLQMARHDGFIDGANFALSLPKQDNVILNDLEKLRRECIEISGVRNSVVNWSDIEKLLGKYNPGF